MGKRELTVCLVFLVSGACELSPREPLGESTGGSAGSGGVPPSAGVGGAAGAGAGTGVAGSSGGTPSVPGVPIGRDPACWTDQLPAQVQPLLPRLGASDACSTALSAGATFRSSMLGTGGSGGDARADIVGRWVPCTSDRVGSVAHAGIEFGANGRWQLLAHDAAGELTPMTGSVAGTTGRYYDLGMQLNLYGEAYESGAMLFLSFAAGMDAVRFSNGNPGTGAVYARTAPSPSNGNDNLPSITDGRCSMVGTWEVPANTNTPTTPPAWLSFDALGNFVGGPVGSDLCVGHTMYGTYRVSPGLFQITANVGMGLCSWWFDAGYPATFDESCTHVMLVQHYDNCTGGRGYLNGQTTLTRR